MITEAIWEEKKWTKGTSRHAIRKFILETYDVDESKLKTKISETLAQMLESNQTKNGKPCLIKVDANYKLTPEWRKEWKSKNGIKPEKRKKKKDKNAPKGVRNGYMFYVQEHRAKRGKEHPDKEATELTKMIATEWRELSTTKKKKYLDMAEEDKKRYEAAMKEYKKRKRDSGSESSEESSKKTAKKKRKTEKSSDSGSSDKKKKKGKKDSESGSSDEKKKKGKKKSNSTEDDSVKKEESSGEEKAKGKDKK
jgi:structure-specific recognition protein 1